MYKQNRVHLTNKLVVTKKKLYSLAVIPSEVPRAVGLTRFLLNKANPKQIKHDNDN